MVIPCQEDDLSMSITSKLRGRAKVELLSTPLERNVRLVIIRVIS